MNRGRIEREGESWVPVEACLQPYSAIESIQTGHRDCIVRRGCGPAVRDDDRDIVGARGYGEVLSCWGCDNCEGYCDLVGQGAACPVNGEKYLGADEGGGGNSKC